MPRFFVHLSFLFFVLTALSGIWMRLFPFNPNAVIPFTNTLHGHSHLAILGWAFLGVFIVFLSLFWQNLKQKTEAKALTITIFIISFLMFIAFLYQGYGLYSIILSCAHIFVEYWAVIFIYRHIKNRKHLPKLGVLFIKASLISLVLSSIGPISLGFISANGLSDSYIFDMAIYFYLHFQYNGWLFLFLIGLFVIILHFKKIEINTHRLSLGFWIYFIALFPSYLLSILWLDLGSISTLIAVMGSVGQWIGVLYILLAFKTIWQPLLKQDSKFTVTCLGITFLLVFIKSTMELGLISPNLAALVYETRSVIIGYLHFTLLGFVSIFILSQYQMIGILNSNCMTWWGFGIFFFGFLLNECLLFLQGLSTWLTFSAIPFYLEGLLIASCLLFAGIYILWFSYAKE